MTTDYGRSEYASYVQLCRELRLERKLQYGDFYWQFGDALLKDKAQVFAPVRTGSPVLLPRGDDAHGTVWLPSLADWLEILKAADWWRRYVLDPLAGGDYRITADGPPVIVGPSGNSDVAYPRRSGMGATYEEAAARLWMAVKKG